MATDTDKGQIQAGGTAPGPDVMLGLWASWMDRMAAPAQAAGQDRPWWQMTTDAPKPDVLAGGVQQLEEGLRKAITQVRDLRQEFWSDVNVLGTNEELNQALERAGRVADFFELAELMCIDALVRRESCGGHFRAESQTEDGEALRHDDEFAYVSAWELEIQNRLKELDSGAVRTIPWTQARQMIRQGGTDDAKVG